MLTVALDTDLDISRGNSIAAADSPVAPEQQFQAALCWFDDIPLNLRRKYLLKHTTQTTPVKISAISYVWDVNTLSRVEPADTLKLNDIGSVSLKTQPADRRRALRRKPCPRRVHPDRRSHQPHRRRRHDTQGRPSGQF